VLRGTHNHPNVRVWLAKQPRFSMHFIPTSSSWLNLVERWFREITGQRIRRRSFASVSHLIAAIEDCIAHHATVDFDPGRWDISERGALELLTQGLTNPQIAERLFISRATVKTHLVHVFTKLGVSTRAQLASEATRRAVR
jgi:DNA-binding CsgD family transcriptional regulator